MRTDAKIGFAIGGVLLAVLTVYAIVVPKHKKTTPGTVTLVTPPSQNVGGTGSSVTPPVVAENTAPVTPPITAMGADQPPTIKETVTPPVIAPVVPPLVVGGRNLSDDGVFYPNGKPDEQKTVVSADPLVPKQGNLIKASRSHHAKEAPASIEPIDGGTSVAAMDDHPYTIKAGQTLSKIASDVYGNSRFWVAIQRENKGLDANHLKVGSKILLPDISPLKPGPIATNSEDRAMLASVTSVDDSKLYVVKSGDNLYGICKRLYGTGRKAKDVYAINKEKIGPDKSKLKLGTVLTLPESPTVQLVAQRP